tara:strand:- start:310 stop:1143 length:834 start_codon:yes stop_codon:yes gene_type:complete
MSIQVAYLGPEGTYAEEAACALARLEKMEDPQFVPCVGLHSVIEHAAKKLCDAAVVPIENSVEGGVTASLDALWSYPELFIRRALILPIQHCLLSSGSINEISEVLSHPQALAQCSGWLNKNLPNALQLPTNSTAEAVKMVRNSKFRAAIASNCPNNLIDLKQLAYPINDVAGNRTRFVLLQREELTQRGDVASLAFSLRANAPGALLKALSFIANLGLNMSRIESRPSKRELGEYIFFVDLDITNAKNGAHIKLIEELKPLCEHLVHFGAYPSTSL